MPYACNGCGRQFEPAGSTVGLFCKKCRPPCDFIIRVDLTPEQRMAIGKGNFASQAECAKWAQDLIDAGMKKLEE